MSDKTTDAFKQAFAERLAHQGLVPSMLEKQAGPLGQGISKGVSGLGKAIGGLSMASKAGLALWLAAPVVVGGALGYGVGNVEGVEPPDLKVMKEQERINNIRRAIMSLKRQQGVAM